MRGAGWMLSVLRASPGSFRAFMKTGANGARAHPEYPHWYLETMGVDPDVQRSGLGGRLLEPVLKVADRDRTDCYLETADPRNAALLRPPRLRGRKRRPPARARWAGLHRHASATVGPINSDIVHAGSPPRLNGRPTATFRPLADRQAATIRPGRPLRPIRMQSLIDRGPTEVRSHQRVDLSLSRLSRFCIRVTSLSAAPAICGRA